MICLPVHPVKRLYVQRKRSQIGRFLFCSTYSAFVGNNENGPEILWEAAEMKLPD